jgi:5-methylcytosine-specific restriction endonuclease McrA
MAIDHNALAIPKPSRKKRKKNHSRRNRTASRAKMVRELDAIARQEVFDRDGAVCIRCSNRERAVQWAHVLSRRHLCTRWMPDNAMTLCAGCHLFWHHEPAMALDWFFKNFRERFHRVQLVLLAGVKVNVKSLWLERCGVKGEPNENQI